MAEFARMTPLAHRAPTEAGDRSVVAISEVADRAMFDLRVRRGDAAAVAALEQAARLTLPAEPRSSNASRGRAALWFSVDQWLITTPLAERDELASRLAEAAHGHFAAVTDMSDARAIIRLAGDGAREVVMKGAAADLTLIPAGTVRRANFAGIAAMFHLAAVRPDVIDVYVFRSCADYAWDWIAAAARPEAAIRLFTPQPPPAV